MIDWSSPIRTECGRPARVLGQASNGPISIAVQFIANNGDLYELNLCSNAAGQVHGGMYQLQNVADESDSTEWEKEELELITLRADLKLYTETNNSKAAYAVLKKIKQLSELEFEKNEISIDIGASNYSQPPDIKRLVEKFNNGAISLRKLVRAVRRYIRVMMRAIDKSVINNPDIDQNNYLCARTWHTEEILHVLSGGANSCRRDLFEALFIDGND